MARAWIWEGTSQPSFSTARTSSGEMPSDANVTAEAPSAASAATGGSMVKRRAVR